MESNKFDNHIKNLLEKREISPSQNAWSQLEDKLDASEKKKKTPWFLYSGIAAALVGVLLMVNLSTKSNNVPTLVETPKANDVELFNGPQNSSREKVIKVVGSSKEKKKTPQYLNAENASTASVVKTIKRKRSNNDEVKKRINKNTQSIETVIANNDLALATSKPNPEQNEKPKISEVEQLLTSALLSTKIEESNTVDAKSLLDDVEFEVEKSFRTRVFSTLKENVADIATSFANRNK